LMGHIKAHCGFGFEMTAQLCSRSTCTLKKILVLDDRKRSVFFRIYKINKIIYNK